MAKAEKKTTTTKSKTAATKKATGAAKTKAAGAAKKKAAASKKVPETTAPVEITHEERWRMIAVAAYHKAEKRGFAPGRDFDDWLESEREVNRLLGLG